MLTLTLDGHDADLPADAAVALSFRSSDLRRLDTREAGFSETFPAPLSALNAIALGTPHALSSQTRSPYRRIPAVLSAGGVPVLTGSAILDASELAHELTLLDDTADLFQRVGETKLRELDLSAYDHMRTYATVQAASTNNPARGYLYALADLGHLTNRSATERIVYSELPPAVYLSAVIDAMMAKALPGFTLTGALLSDARYLGTVLPCATAGPRLRDSYLTPYNVQASTNADRTYTMPANIVGGTGSHVDLVFPVLDLGSPAVFDGTSYTPPFHRVQLTLEGKVFVQNDGTTNKSLNFLLDPAAGNGAELPIGLSGNIIPAGFSGLLTFKVLIPASSFDSTNQIRLRFVNLNYNGLPTTSITVKAGSGLLLTLAPYSLTDAPVHLDASLPDLSCAELLKWCANAFNGTFSVDAQSRTVRLDVFNELEGRRDEAPDWSAKLDYGQRPRLEYRIGDYAQANVFRYHDAPGEYAPTFGVLSPAQAAVQVGQSALVVPDETLEVTKDAYVAPLLLPVVTTAASGRLTAAWLPFYPASDPADPREVEPFESGFAYTAGDRVERYGRVWVYHDSPLGQDNPGYIGATAAWQPEAIPTTSLPTVATLTTAAVDIYEVHPSNTHYTHAVALTRAGLSFAELLPAYHEGTARILQRVQLLTAYFTLTPSDINALDFSRPVYLSIPWIPGYGQIEGYFYLNLIDQYAPGIAGSTRVELLKLGDPIAGLAPAATPLPARPMRALLEERGLLPLRLETLEPLLEEPL